MVAKICFKFHLLIAFSLRLVFTLYGFYHDYEASSSAQNIPKYTDIDYQVFTDAARYVYNVRLIVSVFILFFI
jgi:hypothetical protein